MNDAEMECTCLTGSWDDDGMPDFLSTRTVKARENHKCCECGETIKPGEKYERASGKWDGKLETFKTCLICVNIRASVYCRGGYAYGGLRDDLLRAFGVDYTKQGG